MSTPFLGEIRVVGFNFAPTNWAMCDGSLLAISANDALYVLLGTQYGGDGINTFGLPDFRGRIPIHMGTSNGQTYVRGEKVGSSTVTLTTAQMPAHSHAITDAGHNHTYVPLSTSGGIGGQLLFHSPTSGGNPVYANTSSLTSSVQTGLTTQPVGSNSPINVIQPTLTLNFIISLFGIFPSQS